MILKISTYLTQLVLPWSSFPFYEKMRHSHCLSNVLTEIIKVLINSLEKLTQILKQVNRDAFIVKDEVLMLINKLPTKEYEYARMTLISSVYKNDPLVCAALGWSFSDVCPGSIDNSLSHHFYESANIEMLKKDMRAEALFHLARIYEKGLNTSIKIDHTKAHELYNIAATLGCVGAQCNLGTFYLTGKGVEQDVHYGIQLSKGAASQGFALAQNNLAHYYRQGEGVEKNLVEATHLQKLAAEQGLALAQYGLARCYEVGNGVEEDLVVSVNLYKNAADQGLSMAHNYLAHCYKQGRGAKKDLVEAALRHKVVPERGSNSLNQTIFYAFIFVVLASLYFL